ncbi:signal peptidase II [Hartmannibacter diazotrophicus]|nr:signal peptidase II [Hartmannibacter diazotrophicus]
MADTADQDQLRRRRVIGIAIVLVGLIADQASKLWILGNNVVTSGERLVITPFMDFVLVWNRGISYGLFQQDSATGRWTLLGITVLAVLLLGRWMLKSHSTLAAVALGLVVGGAIGNGIDRFVHGAVVDFVHLHAFGHSWYVFNLADTWIVAGVALLLYDSLKSSHRDAAKDV